MAKIAIKNENITEQAIFDIVSDNFKNREVGSITINH